MQTKLAISILTASIIFTGCGDKEEAKTTVKAETTKVAEPTQTQIAVDKSKEAMSAISEVVKSKVEEVKEVIATQTPVVTKAIVENTAKVKAIVEEKIEVAKKVIDENFKSADTLYRPCAGCHGAKSEKKALGKSAVVKGWSEDKIYESLAGYKAGTYGGTMKGIMKGQVAKLSDGELKSLSAYMAKF